MPNKPFIPIILGTAREGRKTEKVSTVLYDILKNRDDCEVEIVDVKKHSHSFTITDGESTQTWKEMAQKASAFIIVTPEYNHGYPGELKLALDQAYKEYANKPALICSTSNGDFGGTRVTENLTPVLRALSLIVTANTLHIRNVEEFEADKNFIDKVNKAIEELLKLA